MKLKPLLIIILLSVYNFSFSQIWHNDINLIVASQYSKSEKITFINGNEGTVISRATLDEPVYVVAPNKEEDLFYAQTRHYIYKGKLSTGEILDSHKVFDEIEKVKTVDLDAMIGPAGISKQGEAMYMYNEELINALRDMTLAKGMKMLKASKKYSKAAAAPTPFYKINFNTKTKELYKAFDLGVNVPTLFIDGTVWNYSKRQNKITRTDFNADEILQEYDLLEAIERDPVLKNYNQPENDPTPIIINDDLYAVAIFNINKDNIELSENYVALCSRSKRKVLSKFKGNLYMSPTYPVTYTNSDNLVYGKTTSSFNTPKPVQPKMGKIGAFGAKKKLKAFEEKNAVYLENLTQWYTDKGATENNNVTLYKDPELTQEIKTFKGVKNLHIFNSNLVYVQKTNEAILYDIDTDTEKWSIKL